MANQPPENHSHVLRWFLVLGPDSPHSSFGPQNPPPPAGPLNLLRRKPIAGPFWRCLLACDLTNRPRFVHRTPLCLSCSPLRKDGLHIFMGVGVDVISIIKDPDIVFGGWQVAVRLVMLAQACHVIQCACVFVCRSSLCMWAVRGEVSLTLLNLIGSGFSGNGELQIRPSMVLISFCIEALFCCTCAGSFYPLSIAYLS